MSFGFIGETLHGATNTTPTNFLICNGSESVGNSSSNATRHSDEYKDLFLAIWDFVKTAGTPPSSGEQGFILLTSGDAGVAPSGSGALDDWNNNRKIEINLKGLTFFGIDSGDSAFDTKGMTGGAKTKTLASNDLPTHTHAGSGNTDPGSPHTHDFGTMHINESGNHRHNVGYDTGGAQGAYYRVNIPVTANVQTTGYATHTHDTSDFDGALDDESAHTHPNTATGNNTTTNNAITLLNPYIVMNVFIRYKLDGAVSGEVSA